MSIKVWTVKYLNGCGDHFAMVILAEDEIIALTNARAHMRKINHPYIHSDCWDHPQITQRIPTDENVILTEEFWHEEISGYGLL